MSCCTSGGRLLADVQAPQVLREAVDLLRGDGLGARSREACTLAATGPWRPSGRPNTCTVRLHRRKHGPSPAWAASKPSKHRRWEIMDNERWGRSSAIGRTLLFTEPPGVRTNDLAVKHEAQGMTVAHPLPAISTSRPSLDLTANRVSRPVICRVPMRSSAPSKHASLKDFGFTMSRNGSRRKVVVWAKLLQHKRIGAPMQAGQSWKSRCPAMPACGDHGVVRRRPGICVRVRRVERPETNCGLRMRLRWRLWGASLCASP